MIIHLIETIELKENTTWVGRLGYKFKKLFITSNQTDFSLGNGWAHCGVYDSHSVQQPIYNTGQNKVQSVLFEYIPSMQVLKTTWKNLTNASWDAGNRAETRLDNFEGYITGFNWNREQNGWKAGTVIKIYGM